MRRLISTSLLSLSFAGLPAMVGCDRTVEHSKTEDVRPNGDAVTTEKKVTKNADGTMTKTESKDVNKAP